MGEFFAEYGFALLWIVVATAAVLVEAQTCGLVSIWFVPGAVVSMLLALFGVDFWIQVIVFVAFSAITLAFVHTFLKKRLPKKKETKTNVDSLIGAKGIVEEEINNLYEKGSVKVRGLVWTARAANEDVCIPAGSVVTVTGVSGVKLICEPVAKE